MERRVIKLDHVLRQNLKLYQGLWSLHNKMNIGDSKRIIVGEKREEKKRKRRWARMKDSFNSAQDANHLSSDLIFES